MTFPLLVFWVSLAAGAGPRLGTPLHVDGFSFRPPEAFRTVRRQPYEGTRVGAVDANRGTDRSLLTVLMDGSGDDASTLLVTRVEGSFSVSPSGRDDFATAALRHFADELGITLMMERAERIVAPTPRIEVLGSVRQEGQLRQILIAGMEGEGRHAVLLFSIPSGQFEERLGELRASLDTFRNDPAVSPAVPKGVAGAVAGALAGGLLASYAVWRRLRGSR